MHKIHSTMPQKHMQVICCLKTKRKKYINYILNNTNEAYINIYCIVPLFLWWLIIFSPVKLVCVLLLSVSLWIIRSLQLFNATLSVFVIRRLWLWCRRWGIPWTVAECCGNPGIIPDRLSVNSFMTVEREGEDVRTRF